MSNAQKKDWDWKQFTGSVDCLRWSRRDLDALEAALDLTPGRAASVQAGGNLGIFPKRLAEAFAAVYTFEPDSSLFAQLCRNAPAPNIYKFQAALGCVRGGISTACRRRDGSARPIHEGLTHVAGPGAIPTLRIDDLGLAACDLIYLDVEGYELHALMGAVDTIDRCRPTIAVEINRNIEFCGHSAAQLREFILARGYRHALTVRSDEIFVQC